MLICKIKTSWRNPTSSYMNSHIWKNMAKHNLLYHEYVCTWHVVEFSKNLQYSKTTTLFIWFVRYCLFDPPVISSPPKRQRNILFDVISWNGKQFDVSAYSNNFHAALSTFLSSHIAMFLSNLIHFDDIMECGLWYSCVWIGMIIKRLLQY